MDDLKKEAAKYGLDDDLAELAVGGYLSVLNNSEKVKKAGNLLQQILEFLGDDATINLRQYEKIRAQRKGRVPKMPIMGALLHGKKPTVHVEKDAENTKHMIDTLNKQFEGYTEESLVKFMEAFVEYIENEITDAVDIDQVLRMPEKK